MLAPVLTDGVWYISVDAPVEARGDWHRFSSKHCSGSDAFGKYFDSRAHALKTIKEFKEKQTAAVAAE